MNKAISHVHTQDIWRRLHVTLYREPHLHVVHEGIVVRDERLRSRAPKMVIGALSTRRGSEARIGSTVHPTLNHLQFMGVARFLREAPLPAIKHPC